MTRPFASLSWFQFVSLALLSACGGGTVAGKPAEHADPEEDAPEQTGDSAPASDEDEAASEPPALACADGTCTPCGDGLCPNGWYCDETAKGGAACSWLPECAKKPGCACVERVL